MANSPPYRADHVGSLLRPVALRAARKLSTKVFSVAPRSAPSSVGLRSTVSRAYGAWWDHENDRVLAEIKASPKQTVVKLPPDQATQWQARMQPMIAAWAKASPGGEATLATYKKLLADVAAGK